MSKEERGEGGLLHGLAQRCTATHSKENRAKEGHAQTCPRSTPVRINRNTEGRKEKCRKGVPLTLLVLV